MSESAANMTPYDAAHDEREIIEMEVSHGSVASARLVISPHPRSEKLQELVESIWDESAGDILMGAANGTTEFDSQQYAWSASHGETCDFPPIVSRAWTRDGEEIAGFKLKENECQDAAMGNPIGPYSGNRKKNSVVVDINSWVSRSEKWKIAIDLKGGALTCFDTIRDAVQSGKHSGKVGDAPHEWAWERVAMKETEHDESIDVLPVLDLEAEDTKG